MFNREKTSNRFSTYIIVFYVCSTIIWIRLPFERHNFNLFMSHIFLFLSISTKVSVVKMSSPLTSGAVCARYCENLIFCSILF